MKNLIAVDFNGNTAKILNIIDDCLMMVECELTGEIMYVDRELQVFKIWIY